MGFKPEYLVFSGGGGKGSAYIPLIEELEKKNILNSEKTLELPFKNGEIKGYSGTSVGAVMAFLLSIGFNAEEIRNEVYSNSVFKNFLSLEGLSIAPNEKFQSKNPIINSRYDSLVYRGIDINKNSSRTELLSDRYTKIDGKLFWIKIEGLLDSMVPKPLNKINSFKGNYLGDRLVSLKETGGLISGFSVIKTLEKLLKTKIDDNGSFDFSTNYESNYLESTFNNLFNDLGNAEYLISKSSNQNTVRFKTIEDAKSFLESIKTLTNNNNLKPFWEEKFEDISGTEKKNKKDFLDGFEKILNFVHPEEESITSYIKTPDNEKINYAHLNTNTSYNSTIPSYRDNIRNLNPEHFEIEVPYPEEIIIEFHKLFRDLRIYINQLHLNSTEPTKSANTSDSSKSLLSFHLLKEITGNELVVISSNTSLGKGIVFSAETTPNFPVIDAVAMSMNFPLVFKPIHINDEYNTNKPFEGWYFDGGIYNNFPINSFTVGKKDILTEKNYYKSSKQNVLGFKLMGDKANHPKPRKQNVNYYPPSLLNEKDFIFNKMSDFNSIITSFDFSQLIEHMVFNTMFLSQEERTGYYLEANEGIKIVDVDPNGFELLDFVPEETEKEKAGVRKKASNENIGRLNEILKP